MLNLGIILILAAAVASPVPVSSPAPPDPCGGRTTNMLAALNRPTIGFSACAVKPRESVWEFGYAGIRQNDGSRNAVYPQGFIRFGTGRGFELDAIGPNYLSVNADGTVVRGFADSGIGAKYEFFHDDSSAAALDLLYLVPSGALALTAGAPVTTLNFDYGRSLSPAAGAGVTVGAQSSFASDLNGRSSRFLSFVPSAVVTAQTNPRTQLYFEAYGQTKLRPDGGTLFGINGGVQYMLAPWLEVDAELGQTVTDLVRAHYFGAGLGIRL